MIRKMNPDVEARFKEEEHPTANQVLARPLDVYL